MQFAIVGLLVAFAVAAQGGVLPISAYYGSPIARTYSALPYGAYDTGAYYANPEITQYASLPYTAVHAPALSYARHISAPIAYSATPYTYEHAAPIVAIAPAEATYTAVTRGAIHTAPLPGHVLSQTSLNVQPATGTY